MDETRKLMDQLVPLARTVIDDRVASETRNGIFVEFEGVALWIGVGFGANSVPSDADVPDFAKVFAETAAPVMVYEFGRWKYAEEHARRLIYEGHLVRLTVKPDVHYIDDLDDQYVSDMFVLEDLGPRPEKT